MTSSFENRLAGEIVASADAPAALDDRAAAELVDFHEKMFATARQSGQEVYGNFDFLPAITKAGHFRRISIIDGLEIRRPEDSVSVDFGTGPWGFACVFPKLRKSRLCIGIDVSSVALQMAAERDQDIKERLQYHTSDGDHIPLEDESVDIFWGGEVIEHVRDPVVFLQEVSRVCRHGADVILSTPNRDAALYRLCGQDYTIGPEHLALLNHVELLDAADHFLDRVAFYGYESSIWPEIDAFLTDPAKIQELQERALNAPAMASGLILHARNDRDRFASNRRSYAMVERLWNHSSVTATKALTPMRLFGDVYGGLVDANEALTYNIAGRRIILLFWGHDWSGEAEITCEDRVITLDLFSRWGGFKRLVLADLAPGMHSIAVRSTGRKRKQAHYNQVIAYKAIAYSY